MDRLEDKILQYIISGKAAEDNAIDKEIREDPSFYQADFDLMNKIWTASDQLKVYRRVPHDPAWQKIVKETGLEANAKKISMTRQWVIAASLIGLAAVAIYLLLQDPYINYQSLAAEEYILPDSSTIALEEGTTIRYLKPEKFLRSSTRDIFLEGKGTFDVSPDVTKPFKVVTNLTSVEVLGTKFIYEARGDFSESENIEGQVRFAANDGSNSVVLNPGDKASYDGNNMEVVPFEPPPPPPSPPAIPTNNISLADLIDIIGDRYQVELEFTNAVQYSDVVVPVNLNVTDLDSLISDLRDNPLISIEATKTNIGYKVTSLTAEPSSLQADYNFQMYRAGIPPKN